MEKAQENHLNTGTIYDLHSKTIYFFVFVLKKLGSGSRLQVIYSWSTCSPKIPDPQDSYRNSIACHNLSLDAVLRIRRIHIIFGLPDPVPLVRDMDPDPDPSIIKQK